MKTNDGAAMFAAIPDQDNGVRVADRLRWTVATETSVGRVSVDVGDFINQLCKRLGEMQAEINQLRGTAKESKREFREMTGPYD